MDNQLVANAASSVASVEMFSPQVVDAIKTWIAYIGVLATALVVAYTGIRKALRDLSAGEDPKKAAGHPGAAALVGGTIMETTTLLMWSDSNREAAEATNELRGAIRANTEAVKESCKETSELRHQIERLRDKMG